jgi:hypothetical protein
MSAAAQIPADTFLDRVIHALTAVDSDTLRELESAAAHTAPPESLPGYLNKRATLAALLDASARNLRLLRRIAGRHSSYLLER